MHIPVKNLLDFAGMKSTVSQFLFQKFYLATISKFQIIIDSIKIRTETYTVYAANIRNMTNMANNIFDMAKKDILFVRNI